MVTELSQSRLTAYVKTTEQKRESESGLDSGLGSEPHPEPQTAPLPVPETPQPESKRQLSVSKRVMDEEDAWADFNAEVSTVKRGRWSSMHEAGDFHAQKALDTLASPSKASLSRSLPSGTSPGTSTPSLPPRASHSKTKSGATYGSARRSFATTPFGGLATPTRSGSPALEHILGTTPRNTGADQGNGEEGDDDDDDDDSNLKNLQALLAQGQNSKILGDLGYIVEGIASSQPVRVKRDSLMELVEELTGKPEVARTFVASTLPTTVCRELRDESDAYCRFLLACLVCVASVEGGSVVSFPANELAPGLVAMVRDTQDVLARREATTKDKDIVGQIRAYMPSLVGYLEGGTRDGSVVVVSSSLVALSALSIMGGLALSEVTAGITSLGDILMECLPIASKDAAARKIAGLILGLLEFVVTESPDSASAFPKPLVRAVELLLPLEPSDATRTVLLPMALRCLIAVCLHASPDDAAIDVPDFSGRMLAYVLDPVHDDSIALYVWGLLVTISDNEAARETLTSPAIIESLKTRLGDSEPRDAAIRDGDTAAFCRGFCALLLGLVVIYRQSARGFADSEIARIRSHLESLRSGIDSPWGKGFAVHINKVLAGLGEYT